MERELLIPAVENRSQKQLTYQKQMTRYKQAMNHEFYLEALLITYAMLEDRLKSFLYYIGAIRNVNDKKLTVSKTKNVLRTMYFGSEEASRNKKIDIDNISVKEKLIRKTLEWSCEQVGKPEEYYLEVLKQEYEGCLDIDGLLQTLEEIDQWRNYRNEVIHGLLNKDMNCLDSNLCNQVENGMKYARYLDGQIKQLKKNNRIRKNMRIKD